MGRRRPWIGLATLLALAGCSMRLPSPVDDLRKATWGQGDETVSDAPSPVAVPPGTPDAPPAVTPVATAPVKPAPAPAVPAEPAKPADRVQLGRQPLRLPFPEADAQPLSLRRSDEPRLRIGQGALLLPDVGGSPALVTPRATSQENASGTARLSVSGAKPLSIGVGASPRLDGLDAGSPGPVADGQPGLVVSGGPSPRVTPAMPLELALVRTSGGMATGESISPKAEVPLAPPVAGSGSHLAPALPEIGPPSSSATSITSTSGNLSVAKAKPIPGVAELASPALPVTDGTQLGASVTSTPIAVTVGTLSAVAATDTSRAPVLSPGSVVHAGTGSLSVVTVKPGAASVIARGPSDALPMQVSGVSPVDASAAASDSLTSGGLAQAAAEAPEVSARREAERRAREAESREHGSALTRWLRDHLPFFF